MLNLSTWRRFAIAAAITFAFGTARAADVNARIKGIVTDPTGAVVANVPVVATNVATGVKFTTTSQGDGGYLFPQLPIGTYSISASAPGFTSFVATGIVLNISQEFVEPIHLAVGSTTDTLEVAADANQVNTTDMQLSNIVTASQMVELPLIGRNFANLQLTLPGVQASSDRFLGFSVSGSQAQQSEFLINGADTNDFALNSLAYSPNLDAIDQFNLIDGPLNAEYDRNSGGIVSATIKQGSNHFHGDIFEFYRDTFLNTNNFFQKTYTGGVRTDKVSPFHQNIFGGTLGGPIWRDKLFFFGAYQGTRQRVPQSTASNTVYTTAQLGGDFSSDNGAPGGPRPNSPGLDGNGKPITNTTYGTYSAKYIPSTIIIPGCTTPFETYAQCAYDLHGVIPTSAFNSVAKTLTSTYVPAPNSGTSTYSYNSTTNTTANQYIGRIDYDFNPKNQISVLGIFQTQTSTNGLPSFGASVPGFGDGSITHIQQYTFDYVRQISNTTVNDFTAHFTRFNFKAGAPQKIVDPASAGFAITPQDPTNQTIPNIQVSGKFTLGGSTSGPQPRIDQVVQFSDSVSKTFGRHNLKFGYDGRRFSVWNLFDADNSGAYIFNNSGTFSSGDPSLDFLLGVPSSYAQQTNNILQVDAFLNYVFAQDNWRVTDTFTLNYGLGYSVDTPVRNHQLGGEGISCGIASQQSVIFPTAPKGLNFPGDPGCTISGQAYTRYNEFGPRLGFAWAPDLGIISGSPGKFSIRGGFGIYYNRTETETALQTLNTPPYGLLSSGAADFLGKPQFANPFADINGGRQTPVNGAPGKALSASSEPNQFPYKQPVKGQAVDFGTKQIFNISSYDSSFRAPYAENFQLSIERELPSKLVARISYVASLGRRNQVAFEGFPETAAGHAACVADPVCVANSTSQQSLYPGHTLAPAGSLLIEEGEVGSYGTSNYHSLQASLTKGQTHGLYFQMSYTYSHAMDNGSSFENSAFGVPLQGDPRSARGYNQYDTSLNYGDSSYDARQRFVFAPVYTTPVLKGGRALSPLNLAVSGWQISGILTLATGFPFDISYGGFGGSNSLYCSILQSYYACPDIPEQVAPLVHANPRARLANGKSQYFQASSFAPEPIGSFGNIHRDPYHGPGTINTDLILAKNFNLSSDGFRRLQLRMESDNVFNHTNFSLPFTDYSAATTFGTISGAANARQTQLAAKIYF
jgi:hypothetical protein